jgi:CHAT domain-containing protein/Flp pilus assembly protein TadD
MLITISERKAETDRLLQQGNQQFQISQYREALQSWQKALEIYQDIGDRNGEANSLMGLGNAYRNLGQYPKAIDYYQQSLAIQRDIGDRNGEAGSLMGLGNAYRNLGQYPKAIDYYQQSLAIKKEIGDRNGEANSLMGLGNAYRNLGQYQKAIDYYQQSLAIFKEIGDREGEGLTLSNLGAFYEAQNQPELAIVLYKQSVIVREGIRQDLRVLERELQQSYTETVAGTYRRLADLLLSQDRIFEAQQVLELLKLQEIQEFTRSQRARGELPKVVLLPKEQEIIDSYGKLVAFAQNIQKCEQTNCPQLAELRNQRDDLKRQYNQDVKQLETAIRQRTAEDDQFLLPTAFNQTADRVIQASDKYNSEPGTAVIYPLILQDKLWLLWATEGKVIGKREITNVGREQLNKEVLKLRFLLQDPNSDVAELQKTARQLYDWLIKPIEAELEAGNIHHLAFSLDRATRYIPMAVLFDGKQYLIQKYTITTIIAAQFTDTQDRLPAKVNDTPILGVGASKAPGYRPLPNVTSELNSIVRDNTSNASQGIYPGKKLLDAAFTQLNLRDNLTDRKLLHIATHGFFVPGNQYDSYLVLGDGEKLRIPDIQILDDYLDGVHLVVLSACETALGDSFLTDPKQEEGIEINALSFYFLSGGAKTVMASLWRVDDPSTSLLMQRFYCILAHENPSITKAEALRKAQLSLLEGKQMPNCPSISEGEQDFSHPHYWAPFILIGNGL